MRIEYDPHKNLWNIEERNLSFERAKELDWKNAYTTQDTRKDYPEIRLISLAYLEGRLHSICYTPIKFGIRVISFRKANKREVRNYEQVFGTYK